MLKNRFLLLVGLSILSMVLKSHKADEGMFPLSLLNDIDFKKAGFRIQQADIYNPNGIALTDALVRLGGCTGSFISNEGLIITNHHCVFSSVAGVSTKDKDYLENGFYANGREKELPINLTCRITKSYEDVTAKVLEGITPQTSPEQKAKLISQNIELITEQEQRQNPELTIEISEMFVGYSYTLFRYQTLKDVRLVYVPPRTIGEFGGETDNWEWPKHTGDFSMVRAYVDKDGNPAAYNKDNVPFVPKKHLKVNPKGTQNNDLVFILGYPGRTYRHQPAQFVKYQQEFVLPFISEWYGWRIKKMEEISKGDRALELKFAGTIKSLANVKKNFEGKIYGLKQTKLLETKIGEQTLLANQSKLANAKNYPYTTIDSIYNIKLKDGAYDMLLSRFNSDCGTLVAALIIEANKIDKVPSKNDSVFWNKCSKNVRNNLKSQYRMVHPTIDKQTLSELIKRNKRLVSNQQIKALKKINNPDKWVEKAYCKTYFDEPTTLFKMLDSVPWKVYSASSAINKLAKKLLPELKALGQKQKWQNEQLDALLPLLLEDKIKFSSQKIVPDANSTLRLTYGYVSAYRPDLNPSPYPFTYRTEIFKKNATDNIDYRLIEPVKNMLKTENINSLFIDPTKGDVPVCILYNMDTTGGNSGSPIMDADGNLVGVNFDRAYTATLNDYSWNKDYSRSIGVDIRYVLYTMYYMNKCQDLFAEMGIAL